MRTLDLNPEIKVTVQANAKIQQGWKHLMVSHMYVSELQQFILTQYREYEVSKFKIIIKITK